MRAGLGKDHEKSREGRRKERRVRREEARQERAIWVKGVGDAQGTGRDTRRGSEGVAAGPVACWEFALSLDDATRINASDLKFGALY